MPLWGARRTPPVCECDMLCSWYYIWIIRSPILKAGSILLIIAFLLEVVSLVTGCWLTGEDGCTGLFDMTITGSSGDLVPVPILCPILATLSVIILFCDNILNILFATRRFHLVMPAVIVFAFIGALMMMTVIVTWSVPDVTMGHSLSWSFVVATVAVVVEMMGCGLCVMEFLSRREIPRVNSNFARFLSDENSGTELDALEAESTDQQPRDPEHPDAMEMRDL